MKFNEDVRRGTGNVVIRNYDDPSQIKAQYDIAADQTNIQWDQNDTVMIGTRGLAAGHYYLEIPGQAIMGVVSGHSFPGFTGSSDYDFYIISPLAAPALNPPSNGALVNIDQTVNLTMTFAQPMKLGAGGSIQIKKYADDSIQHTVNLSTVAFNNTDPAHATATIPGIQAYLEHDTKDYVAAEPSALTDLNAILSTD